MRSYHNINDILNFPGDHSAGRTIECFFEGRVPKGHELFDVLSACPNADLISLEQLNQIQTYLETNL